MTAAVGSERTWSAGLVAMPAWGLCGLFVVMVALSAVLDVGDTGVVLVGALQVGYVLVGALVAVHEPRNTVGWLMLAIGTSIGAKNLVDAYVSDLDRPFVAAVAWVGSGLGGLAFCLVALMLPLLFPDGRLLSARWRPVAGLGLLSLVCSQVGAAVGAGPMEVASEQAIVNPLSVTGAARTVVSVIEVSGSVLFVVAAALSIAALLTRLRHSSGRPRQQVKWFVYVTSLALCALLLGQAEVWGPGGAWTETLATIGYETAIVLVSVGIPVAVGIAILRYRLYDIDLVIKRTLVYGLVSVTLGSAYWVLVFGLPRFVDVWVGGDDLMVAASTLAVAALFRPVRGRVQQLVDRRFDRSKYDATLTVESFAGRLRHEVDLEAVTGDLEVVVRDTVQPTHVTLWLRDGP